MAELHNNPSEKTARLLVEARAAARHCHQAARCFPRQFHNSDMLTLCFHTFPESEPRTYLPSFDFPLFSRRRSSVAQRTRLERSVITAGDKGGRRPRAARTRDATGDRLEGKPPPRPPSCTLLVVFACLSPASPASRRAAARDQAPHLVYLTS